MADVDAGADAQHNCQPAPGQNLALRADPGAVLATAVGRRSPSGARRLVGKWLLGLPADDHADRLGSAWLATVLAYLGGWMAIFAVAYLTASLLAAIVIMPLMLKHLAETDYRDVAAMGKDSFTAAAVNSVFASILFIVGWLLTCRCGSSPASR
jgi:hypothetical protein